MNTHSHEADCRAELLASAAVRAGASLDLVRRLLEIGTTEEAVELLKAEGILKEVIFQITSRISFYMNHHIEGKIPTEAVIFSSNEGLLGMTDGAAVMLERLKER